MPPPTSPLVTEASNPKPTHRPGVAREQISRPAKPGQERRQRDEVEGRNAAAVADVCRC